MFRFYKIQFRLTIAVNNSAGKFSVDKYGALNQCKLLDIAA